MMERLRQMFGAPASGSPRVPSSKPRVTNVPSPGLRRASTASVNLARRTQYGAVTLGTPVSSKRSVPPETGRSQFFDLRMAPLEDRLQHATLDACADLDSCDTADKAFDAFGDVFSALGELQDALAKTGRSDVELRTGKEERLLDLVDELPPRSLRLLARTEALDLVANLRAEASRLRAAGEPDKPNPRASRMEAIASLIEELRARTAHTAAPPPLTPPLPPQAQAAAVPAARPKASALSEKDRLEARDKFIKFFTKSDAIMDRPGEKSRQTGGADGTRLMPPLLSQVRAASAAPIQPPAAKPELQTGGDWLTYDAPGLSQKAELEARRQFLTQASKMMDMPVGGSIFDQPDAIIEAAGSLGRAVPSMLADKPLDDRPLAERPKVEASGWHADTPLVVQRDLLQAKLVNQWTCTSKDAFYVSTEKLSKLHAAAKLLGLVTASKVIAQELERRTTLTQESAVPAEPKVEHAPAKAEALSAPPVSGRPPPTLGARRSPQDEMRAAIHDLGMGGNEDAAKSAGSVFPQMTDAVNLTGLPELRKLKGGALRQAVGKRIEQVLPKWLQPLTKTLYELQFYVNSPLTLEDSPVQSERRFAISGSIVKAGQLLVNLRMMTDAIVECALKGTATTRLAGEFAGQLKEPALRMAAAIHDIDIALEALRQAKARTPAEAESIRSHIEILDRFRGELTDPDGPVQKLIQFTKLARADLTTAESLIVGAVRSPQSQPQPSS